MASSASVLLKIEKQADGENDSTWGSKLNQAYDVIEEAIAGQATISTDGDVTLSDTQFVSNEARKAVLNCTAALTANRVINVPARTKLYVVRNNTSGAYTLTVKTSAGTGIAVTQGEIAWLYCDGTNVIKIFATDDITALLANVVEDTTPQLGGDLDANGNNILMDDATGINDDSDNELIRFQKTASAVNHLDVTNAAAGGAPDIAAVGDDTNIDLTLTPKGSGSVNLQDKSLKRPKLIDYGEAINAIGSIGGGTQDIDLTLGNVVTGTVDTSTTTFTFSNPSASGTCCSFTLILTNGGSQTVNWPASVDWSGAQAPVLTASGVDVLTFFTLDGGTTWYGFLSGIGMG